jgi:excisionase family DNA binding protein
MPHLPPTLRACFSPAVVRDLEAWMRDVITEEIRRRVDEAAVSPWMTTDQAADWLGCNRRRIYDLCQQGRLTRHRDEGRLLLRRAEVEGLVTEDGRDEW